MSTQEIIRAWKDEEFRNSLSKVQRSQLPENPAGLTELSNADLETFSGGSSYGGAKPSKDTICHLK